MLNAEVPRWELYRLLADPVRVRLIALASLDEFPVGELAELLRESQSKISKHVTALRDAQIVAARRQGTFVLVRLDQARRTDPIVVDAIRAGKAACKHDGTWEAAERALLGRDARAEAFFASKTVERSGLGVPAELGAYLSAFAPLLPGRALAVDAGTGHGALLEMLCPLFDHVIAFDRSEAQINAASTRAKSRGFENVSFVVADIGGQAVKREVARVSRDHAGADLVFASRLLHHAKTPSQAVGSLTSLLRPGGHLSVLDYAPHDDVELRDSQADLWLGFSPEELRDLAREAGLVDVAVTTVPQHLRGSGPDRHIEWLSLIGRTPLHAAETSTSRNPSPKEKQNKRKS